jgi:hypothetical protein
MVVAPALQTPVPSQAEAPSTTLPLQLPFAQVLPKKYWQAPAPSQSPLYPHFVASVALQSEALRGAEPAVRRRQVPPASGAVQVSQPSVQALSQQTPSTQWPFVHSPSQAQAAPLACLGPVRPQVDGPASPPSGPPSPWGDIPMSARRSPIPASFLGVVLLWPPQPTNTPARNSTAAVLRKDFIKSRPPPPLFWKRPN